MPGGVGVGLAPPVWFSHSEVTVAKSQPWGPACSPAPMEAGRGSQGHGHTHSVPQTSADEGPVTIFIICFYIHALRISTQGQHQTPALKGDLPSSRPEGHLGGHSHIYIFSGTFPVYCHCGHSIQHCLKAYVPDLVHHRSAVRLRAVPNTLCLSSLICKMGMIMGAPPPPS